MILYYLAESFKSFRRAKLASFVTLLTTCIAVLITSFSIILLFLSGTIEEKLKNQIEINIFLKDSVTSQEIQQLRNEFANDQYIRLARFISKEDAIKRFIEETGEDFRSVLDINPLPASFVVMLKSQHVTEENLNSIVQKYKNKPSVDEINYDYSTTLTLLNVLEVNKTLIYGLSLIMIIIALYFIYLNNKLVSLARQKQFDTMKLVGARLSSIKIPIIINSIILGFISSLICLIIFNLAVFLLTKVYYNIEFFNFLYLFNFVIVALGILLGFIGSFFATKGITLKVSKS